VAVEKRINRGTDLGEGCSGVDSIPASHLRDVPCLKQTPHKSSFFSILRYASSRCERVVGDSSPTPLVPEFRAERVKFRVVYVWPVVRPEPCRSDRIVIPRRVERRPNILRIRSFYRFSARCFIITLTLMFSVSVVAFLVGRPGLNDLPFALVFPMGTLGALCAVLFIPFWIGMMWDCLFLSRLPLYSKVAWFLFIALTVYLGLLVYYFLVFERRNPRMDRRTDLLH